jgi:RNA polymerase sigma-70 factor (ECF subfamily)
MASERPTMPVKLDGSATAAPAETTAPAPSAVEDLTFDELVARQAPRVAACARRLLGWQTEVDDVVQEVFVRVLDGLPRFRGAAQLSTWIFRITVNECRRVRRRRLLQLRFWGRLAWQEPRRASPVSSAVDDTGERVRAAVRALPRAYREVVVLRYLEELPVAEVASILGIRANAVDVRLHRARAELRRTLGGAWGDPS